MAYSSTLDILEEAPTLDLTVLETAKSELGITDTSQDAKLTRWIHEISGQIGAKINRVLGREKVTETFHIDGVGFLDPLPLKRWPVAIIDSVTACTMQLDSTQYRFDKANGLLYRRYGRWYGETVVQYQAGYQLLGELPYDLERACLLLLKYRQAAGNRDPMIKSEVVPNVYEVDYWVGSIPGSDASMPPDVADLLAPYKDVAV